MTDQTLPIDQAFAAAAGDTQLARAAKALESRNLTAHIVDTLADARRMLLDLLPTDKEILTALSETLRLSGLTADIDEGDRFRSVRRRLAEHEGDFDTQLKLGATPDVVVGSVHAVTEDGVLLAASATGSQLAPYAATARSAYWIVGAQKVVPDLETALRRVRTYSLPMEQERLKPSGVDSFIGKLLILEREFFPGRSTVILVREPVGY